MTTSAASAAPGAAIRRPAVSGSFYPAQPGALTALIDVLFSQAERLAPARDGPDLRGGRSLTGLLVPHAGLVYSGAIACAGWRLVGTYAPDLAVTVVLLGTNHRARWLQGVAAWERGAWRTPLGDVAIDAELAQEIVELGPPFVVDREAHRGEHSLEVQLPLLQTVRGDARIVPLSVAAGTGETAIEGGRRLGALLAGRREQGRYIVLAISSDMAHYPPTLECARVTTALLPPILALDPAALADAERGLVAAGRRGLVCGMCGIEPTVLGLAALDALGATSGHALAAATSTAAGGPVDRAVGYLTVAFTLGSRA